MRYSTISVIFVVLSLCFVFLCREAWIDSRAQARPVETPVLVAVDAQLVHENNGRPFPEVGPFIGVFRLPNGKVRAVFGGEAGLPVSLNRRALTAYIHDLEILKVQLARDQNIAYNPSSGRYEVKYVNTEFVNRLANIMDDVAESGGVVNDLPTEYADKKFQFYAKFGE